MAGFEGFREAGKAIFALACLTCHSVGGEGGKIGPVLDGAGAMGMADLLAYLNSLR